MEEIWTKKQTLDFLRKNPLATIAVNSADYPVSSVVLFHIDDDFKMYFVTGRQSYKAMALFKNPKLSFVVWEPHLASAQGIGIAEEVADEKEIGVRMDEIVKASGNLKDFWPPLLGIWKHDYVIFRIKVEMIMILDLSHPHLKENEPKFTKIDFTHEK